MIENVSRERKLLNTQFDVAGIIIILSNQHILAMNNRDLDTRTLKHSDPRESSDSLIHSLTDQFNSPEHSMFIYTILYL